MSTLPPLLNLCVTRLILTVRSPVDLSSPKPRNNPCALALAFPRGHESQCMGVPMSACSDWTPDSPLTARATVRPAEAEDERVRERVFMKLGLLKQVDMYLIPPEKARSAVLKAPRIESLDLA